MALKQGDKFIVKEDMPLKNKERIPAGSTGIVLDDNINNPTGMCYVRIYGWGYFYISPEVLEAKTEKIESD